MAHSATHSSVFFFAVSEEVRVIDHLPGGLWQCLSDIDLTVCNIVICRHLCYDKYSGLHVCRILYCVAKYLSHGIYWSKS